MKLSHGRSEAVVHHFCREGIALQIGSARREAARASFRAASSGRILASPCSARSPQSQATLAPLVTDRDAPVDESCGAFTRLQGSLEPGVHRLLVGADAAPQKMTDEQIREDLGDPFATELLLQGTVPSTPEELLSALKRTAGAGDPLGAQMSFIVGEGSQIAMSPETAAVSRNLRFVVTTGPDPNDGPDILLSASFPDQTDRIELMAWDRRAGGFNYYTTTIGNPAAWVFAGNSRHALSPPTEGKGPFESHLSGALLMKELRAPWMNWHSPDANILPSAFAEGDSRVTHPWFIEKEPLGAVTLEAAVAKPAMRRWAKARFNASLQEDGSFESPRRVMRQILGAPTANLITSHIESRKAVREESFDVPQTFFVDSEGLTEILGLRPPPPFNGVGSIYAQTLQKFQTKVDDENGFVREGDTHFAFLVPERAFEDNVVLKQSLDVGLLTPRLAVSLLMTDFPNPIFSARREALLAHVPETATITNGNSTFSQEMADVILAAAEQSAAGSSEREFAERWNVGEDFVVPFSALLQSYYEAVTAQLKTQKGFDAYYRLAESRRRRAQMMPIFGEFSLLFAKTEGIPPGERSMRADGTVEEP